MSTVALDIRPGRLHAGRRPGLIRLAGVELRKMTDTRSGFWLLVGVILLTVGFAAVTAAVGHAEDRTLRNLVAAALFPAEVLLPVVGILLMSSEWSQRTGMITFALVPQRHRVLAAKLAAAVALSVVALALALGVGAVTAVFAAPDLPTAWSLPGSVVGQEALLAASGMIMGVAFGAVLLSSPPAIVLYFGLPLAFQALAAIPGADGPAEWLDGSRSLAHMPDHALSEIEWARAGTTLATWVALPLLLGVWRIARSEVR